MKLKAKIQLFSTVVAFSVLLAVNLLAFYLFQQFSYSNAAQPLRNDIQQIASAFTTVQEPGDLPTILRAYVPENGAIRVLEDGQVLTSVESAESLHSYEVSIPLDEPYIRTKSDLGTVISVTTPALLGTGEIIQVELHQLVIEVDSTLTLLRRTLLIATLLGALLLFTTNFILGRQITAPIERLIKQMKTNRESSSYQSIHVEGTGKDETSQMSREFNAMMEQLEENYVKQEQFVSNASHELKTPLTIIESYARLLKRRGTGDPQLTEEALEAITTETERMRLLMEQFLELARSTQGVEVVMQEVDIVPVVEALSIQLERIYNRAIHVISPQTVMHKTDESRLRQLLTVLIDNAQKYSEKDIAIEVTNHVIRIQDQGIGIPEADLPHLFDRFYRVDQARTRTSGGSGIGLSIAKSLADQLKVVVDIESELGKGTTVILTFPKN